METRGLNTVTHKLTINDNQRDHKFYVKIGWWRGRPVSVDVTMARHGEGNTDTLDVPRAAIPLVVELRQRILENSRSALELLCREASLLLSSRRCTLGDLADLWRVTQMEPKGRCRQVNDEVTGDRVHGPLDAAAKLFKLKAAEWEAGMAYEYTEEEVEKMVTDCIEALDERPDDFTGWETSFIEDIAEQNETTHLSENQIEKLEQIWEERNCG